MTDAVVTVPGYEAPGSRSAMLGGGCPAHRRRPRGWRRVLRWGLTAAVGVVLIVLLGVGAGWPLTPSVSDAEARISGRLVAFGAHDDMTLPVPDRVGRAVVAVENSRFFSDYGVDPLGAARWVTGAWRGGDFGGATIEQQLAKVVYTSGSDNLTAKAQQVELALKFDQRYTKTQVLEMYLNAVYFGNGFYGLTAAAAGYFGERPYELDWAQASLLAGVLQAPSAYDPLVHLDLARARQQHVLARLVATGVLSQTQAAIALVAPLRLRS